MDDHSYTAALRRASKRLAHATRQLGEATSARSAARHARRVKNARALARDALWTFDRMAYVMEGGEA